MSLVVLTAATIAWRLGYLPAEALSLSLAVGQTVTDWMQGWGSVVSAAASLLVLVGLYLTAEQIKAAHRWNQLNATFQYFHTSAYAELDRIAAQKLTPCGVRMYLATEPLKPDQVKAIIASDDALGALKNLINFFDDFAAAISSGAVDNDLAFRMMSGLVIRYGRVFRPFIDQRRLDIKAPKAHCEFLELVDRWTKSESKATTA